MIEGDRSVAIKNRSASKRRHLEVPDFASRRSARTEAVVRRVNALEKLDDVRELRPLLAG